MSKARGLRDFHRLGDRTGRSMMGAVHAFSKGQTLNRKMTVEERECLAVFSANPTHALHLSSRGLGRTDLSNEFQKYLKRLNRRSNHPLIYWATPAQSLTHSGHHLHILLWRRLHALAEIHPLIRDLGFGSAKIQYLGDLNDYERLTATAYHFKQHSPVFGSTRHLKHAPLPKHQRRHSYPQRKTLEKENPQLLSALDLAQSQAVSDEELLQKLPIFNRYRRGY